MFPLDYARRAAKERAQGQCEVMVRTLTVGAWHRCPGWGDEVHHLLPRARGGVILDEAREDYHLIVLCRDHHRQVHAHPERSYVAGLTIDGYVVTDKLTEHPVYTGTDPYLLEKYGEFAQQADLDGPPDHATPRPLAGPARRRPAAS